MSQTTVVYVAILEDRHFSTALEVFTKPIKALKQITEWQFGYKDEIWVEENIEGWEYYVRSDCDDGPKMRIEKKELR